MFGKIIWPKNSQHARPLRQSRRGRVPHGNKDDTGAALLANGLRCVAPCSCKTRSTRGERARAARSLRPVLWFPPRLARRSACVPPGASHHSAKRTTAAWCLALNGAVRAVACNVHVDRRRGPITSRRERAPKANFVREEPFVLLSSSMVWSTGGNDKSGVTGSRYRLPLAHKI